MKIAELVGWIGTALVLLGYALLATGVIASDIRYYIPMLIGSLGVAYISYIKRAWQPCVLNAIFALFSAVALIRILL